MACRFSGSGEPSPQLSTDSAVSNRLVVGEPSVEDRPVFTSFEGGALIGLAVLPLRVNQPGLPAESTENGVIVVHVEVASHV